MSEFTSRIQEARALFHEEKYAVLCTNSVRMPAFPIGSLTPYCLDQNGNPVILVSSISQEGENILESRQVSLVVTEARTRDIRSYLGVTCLADASRIEADELPLIADRFYHYFPEFSGYHEMPEFTFYRLEMHEIRCVRGMGRIFWIKPEDFLLPNPFPAAVEKRITSHMTSDNQDALKYFLASIKDYHLVNGHIVEMIGIDSEGCDLRVEEKHFRIAFDRPVHTLLEARNILAEMSKQPAG